uniref:Aminotransferase n=1 Tax=viral metagenome TaxID=1070528 RepID=A0A6C0IVV2_9ZZZZ
MRLSSILFKTLVPWSKQLKLSQPIITHANGSYIYSKNKEIVDFTSGLMVVNLGHNNKYIKKGFSDYLDNGLAYVSPSSFSTYQRDKLSDRLCDIVDFKDGKVFYTNAGADANETAMFIANNYTGKQKSISLKKSFHGGSSIVSCLISGDSRRFKKQEYYNLPLEPIIPNPNLADNGIESINTLKQIIKNDNNIASLIIEGSSGSAHCVPYPKGYLKKVQNICNDNNIVMICDEVMSGWGRTGSIFAFQKDDVVPDLITTAKGLTSGYSQLGAVIINNKVSDIYENDQLLTGLTYFGHPLSCSIANRCLDLYLESDMRLVKNVESRAKLINTLSQMIARDCDIVNEYRYNGLLGCIELCRDDPTLLRDINKNFYDNGIYCYMREDRIFISPPLTIEYHTITTTMHKIHNILRQYNK